MGSNIYYYLRLLENPKSDCTRIHEQSLKNKWLKIHNSKYNIPKPEENSRDEIIVVF